MAFQSAPDMAEAVIHWSFAGKPLANVLNFRRPGGYNQAQVQSLAETIDIAVGATWLPEIVAQNIDYEGVSTKGLEFENDVQGIAFSEAGPGTVAFNAQAANVSYVISTDTGLTGRSARGRTYLPPLWADALSASNTVTTTYRDDALDAMADIWNAAASAGWVLSVLSRVSGGSLRPVGLAFEVIALVAHDLIIDSQRRRINKS